MLETNRSISEPTQNFSEGDIAILPLQIFITLVGIPGNALVITIVRKNRPMRTPTNFLLVNLAVVDLLPLVWLLPSVGLKSLKNPGGTVGSLLCKFITFNTLPSLTVAASGLTLSVLAVERYNALLKPMRPMFRLTEQTVGYAIGIIWLICFSNFLLFAILVDFDENRRLCMLFICNNCRTTFNAMYATSMIVTLVTILFCYARIIKGIYFSNTICSAVSNSQEDAKSKRKVVKLLITVTVFYVICQFVPYMFSVFLDLFSTIKIKGIVLHRFVVTITYFNSSINPFILAFQSSNYKEGFKNILRKSCLVKLFQGKQVRQV